MPRGFPRLAIISICVLIAPLALSAQIVTESTLYNFTGGSDGMTPNPLVQGSDGNFYGTAVFGGNNMQSGACDQGSGCGTIFRITPNGTFTVLYTFTGGGDGAYPNQLIEGSDGNYYGTTINGGLLPNCTDVDNNAENNIGCGTIFRIMPSEPPPGNFTVLYSFEDGADGSHPVSLIQGSDGKFYGTNIGTVFQFVPPNTLNPLYTYNGAPSPEGSFPMGLVEGSPGIFYGATQFGGVYGPNCPGNRGCGTVFNVTTNSYNILYMFKGGSGGQETPTAGSGGPNVIVKQGGGNGHGQQIYQCPHGQVCGSYGAGPGVIANALVEGRYGRFFGTTPSTETISGTVFSVAPSGNLSTLCSFDALPPDPLWLGSDGNFYGESFSSVFQMPATGNCTDFYDFTGNVMPSTGDALVQGSDGNFYGPAVGGNDSSGSIFKLSLSPPFSPPVELSLTSATISLGSSVTLNWNVYNGFSTTLQQCYASVQHGATGAGNWSGLQTGAVTDNGYYGSATLTPTAVGAYTYALTCGGVESGFVTLVVNRATTVTTFVSSLNPSNFGQSVTFTATVSSPYGTPPGAVNIWNGKKPFATMLLDANGVAKVTYSDIPVGTYSLTASYGGTAVYEPSGSPVLGQVVRKAGTATSH